MPATVRPLLSLCAALSLVACGGGGGSSPAPAAAPTGLTATPGGQAVTLRWDVSAATTYQLYWTQGGPATAATGTRLSGVTSPYVQAGLTAGATYHYVLTASSGGAESVASADVSATPVYLLAGQVLLASPVVGASVSLRPLGADGSLGAALPATATTDGLGGFSFSLATAPASPLVAMTSGGTCADLVTGAALVLQAGQALSAVVPVGTTQVAITPLTNMAASRARALAAAGSTPGAAAAAANAGVGRQFQIADVLETLPPAANNALQVSLATLDQRAYALVLAGLDQEASQRAVGEMALVSALALDLADGLLDGLAGSAAVPLGAGTLGPAAGPPGLQAAIAAFAASSLNQTGLTTQPVLAAAAPVGVSGALYVAIGGLPAWRSGQAGTARVTASSATATCVFSGLPAWLTAAGCTLSGTAPILAAGTTRSVSAPFTVTVTDGGSSQIATLTVTVVQAAPALTLVQPAPGGTVGQAYDASLVASATGGSAPYTFRSDTFANGTPPPGTVVDLGGHLVGTPSLPGTYAFGVCAVDLVGLSRCASTSVTVVKPPTPVTVATWQGSFGGSGTFTRTFVGWTTCTFYDTFDGTVALTSSTLGGTTRSTVHVQGNFVSKAIGGSTASFTCLDSSTPWETEGDATLAGSAASWTTAFTTPGGTQVTGAFAGASGTAAITGTLTVTMDTSSGQATMPVSLARQ